MSNDKTYAGVEADCAHEAKLVIPLFQSCLRSESRLADTRGSYRFRLKLPRRPANVAVLDAGSSGGRARVRTAVRGSGVDFTVTATGTARRGEARLGKLAARAAARHVSACGSSGCS